MKEIIISAKNGDSEAFGSLYESCRNAGLSVAKQYVKNDTDAEDMYQDAFLKAMENIDRFDENREFGPWLNTIIANTCKDFLGKKRPMNFTDMSDEETEFVDTIESSDVSSLPESVYVRKEMLQIVDGIVETLPNEQKEATVLFYFKDFSVKQVAEYQKVSEDTVKSRLNYSRKKVEQATKDYEKKHGIKICIASVIPAILVLYFKNSAYAAQFEAALSMLSASGALPEAGIGAKAGMGAAKAGAVAGKVAAWKIAAIVVASAVVATGAGFAIHHFVTSGDREETVIEDSENTSEIGSQTENDIPDESETSEDAGIQEEPVLEEVSPVKEAIKNAQVGDIIEIGSFEQDGDEANGAEPIEWQVIADEDGKKLLLSKDILMPLGNMMYEEYPGDGVNYTWKECGIRTYLNGEFYESAFTDEERAQIVETEIRTTWQDNASLGAELVDVETISYESLGTVFTHEEGKIVTIDKIFIPDFDEDFARYLKVEKGSWFMYGTDLLAKATVASSVTNIAYEQWAYDEAKGVCSEDVNLDESLIGDEFGCYIMRNGGSYEVNNFASGIPGDMIRTTAFYVVSGDSAGAFSPWYLTELTDRTDVGIRPEMWVYVE
ncbi:MAG: sigma-70 family RNA polymerase sigma factor [Lachnospiraceae bacterium]|nr:sigma-70 family RNA polymerase sigma factor [Lachnospiraceae bacterium]